MGEDDKKMYSGASSSSSSTPPSNNKRRRRMADTTTSSSSSSSTSTTTAHSSWSYSFAAGSQGQLTSQKCSEGLTALLRHSIHILPIAVESCSHPSGIDSLLLQPYSYAGNGLGNLEECPLLTCLALQPGRDGMPPYAGVCVPSECQASDLTSYDFVATLQRNLPPSTTSFSFLQPQDATNPSSSSSSSWDVNPFSNITHKHNKNNVVTGPTAEQMKLQLEWAMEYVTIFERINEINNYLPSGWTCGEWRYPIPMRGTAQVVWNAFVLMISALLLGTATGTYRGWQQRQRIRRLRWNKLNPQRKHVEPEEHNGEERREGCSQHDDETVRLLELHPVGTRSEERGDRTLFPSTPISTTTTPLTVSSSTATPFRCSPDSDQFGDTTTTTPDDTSPLLRSPVSSSTPSALRSTELTPRVMLPSTATTSATVPLSQDKDACLRSTTQRAPKEHDETGCWDAFDWYDNHARLMKNVEGHHHRDDPTLSSWNNADRTSCLHGVRVISLMWIVLGHTAAITSSTGPGYTNPGDVLPPHGWAITMPGQLIFASRFAVDTFLVLSGFLLVITTARMVTPSAPTSHTWKWPILMVVSRIMRILPTYLTCLGVFVFVAPRYWGSGAFWYQWQSLLQPCTEYGWTNLLFVNNFYPTDTSTTSTCFYHSWYLAVDVQVFVLGVLILVVYRRSQWAGLASATCLFVALTVMQAVLTYERNWSLNTFDGAAVARYDVEAYAKPHVRAPSYLAGMICAMILLRNWGQQERLQVVRPSAAVTRRDLEDTESTRHRLKNGCTTAAVLACCATMGFVTFCTASGAYARRPCQYGEWPHEAGCGSLWSPRVTFLYTAFSRTLWVLAVSTLLFLMCGGTHVDDGPCEEPPLLLKLVRSILSLPLWTLPSKLSFASYLMHPIWLFVWQLGAPSSKYAWRWTTFSMQYMAVCVMTLTSSYVISGVVEAPCARLWKRVVVNASRQSASKSEPSPNSGTYDEDFRATRLSIRDKAFQKTLKYGSVDGV